MASNGWVGASVDEGSDARGVRVLERKMAHQTKMNTG